MIIKRLYIEDGIEYEEFEFDSKTLIFSNEHTQGKTTLIRLILFGLGFLVPSIQNFDFKKVTTRLELIDSNNNYIVLTRIGNKFVEYVLNNEVKKKFTLKETSDLHCLLFNLTSMQLIKNILGTFYIDQKKGATTIGNGEVIEGISFNATDLIAEISGKDIRDKQIEIQDKKNEIRDYEQLHLLFIYKEKTSLDEHQYLNKKTSQVFSEQEKSLIEKRMRRKEVYKKLNELESVIKSNNDFIDLLESYKVAVTVDNEIIPVTKDNLRNFNENNSLLNIQYMLVKKELDNIDNEVKKAAQQLKEIPLFNVKDYIVSIKESLRHVEGDSKWTEKEIKRLKSELKQLYSDMHKTIETNNELVTTMTKDMHNIMRELGYQSNKESILMKDHSRESGIALFVKVIASKITYLKIMRERYNLNLPFIIDTFKTNEMNDQMASKILNVIRIYLIDHQIIIASNSDIFDSYKKITVTRPLLKQMKNFQI